MSLQEAIKNAILSSSMTQYRICKLSDIENSVLSRFMRGQGSLTLTTTEKLCEVLNLKLVGKRNHRCSGSPSQWDF